MSWWLVLLARAYTDAVAERFFGRHGELDRLIDHVEAGEDVCISRRDEPVAVIVSYERYQELTSSVGATTTGGAS